MDTVCLVSSLLAMMSVMASESVVMMVEERVQLLADLKFKDQIRDQRSTLYLRLGLSEDLSLLLTKSLQLLVDLPGIDGQGIYLK